MRTRWKELVRAECTSSAPRGVAVAAALAGAWRQSPPKLEMASADLTAVIPLLLGSGAGALGWWRLRNSGAQFPPFSQNLQKIYMYYAIHAAKHQREVAETFAVLRTAGVEPILIKGWAIGRHYPESGLRPSGDIDLWVSPDQHTVAQSVLNRPECARYCVDLHHDQIRRFEELSVDELYNCSELVELENTVIRVLGAEDHLRILCLHFLKHGAWRPLWLCDIAAALESRPPSFDWTRCLGKNARRANWILCTIGLARQLLGASAEGLPLNNRIANPPKWLVQSVLSQWEAPYERNLPLVAGQIRNFLREPTAMLKDLPKRWRNPIQAMVDANASFDGMIRLPFQVGDCFARAFKLLR